MLAICPFCIKRNVVTVKPFWMQMTCDTVNDKISCGTKLYKFHVNGICWDSGGPKFELLSFWVDLIVLDLYDMLIKLFW